MLKEIKYTYRKWRGRFRRTRRLLFISPAEARFIELMGGRVIRIRRVRHWRSGFPIAVYWNLGKTLKSENFKREVRIGKYFVDFGNDIGWCIEVDGAAYHQDVLADLERESYLIERGQRIMRIPAFRLGLDPKRVQADVLKFMS